MNLKIIIVLGVIISGYHSCVSQMLNTYSDTYDIIQFAGKFGLINKQNAEIVLPAEYDYIPSSLYSQGFLIRKGNKCFFFNPVTHKTLTPQDVFPHNSEGYALPISSNDKYGFVDRDGNVIIEGQWDYATDFANSTARVVNNGGYDPYLVSSRSYPNPGQTGYINLRGKYIIPMKYSYIDWFTSSKFRITRFTRAKYECTENLGCENPYKNGRWGLINDDGKIIVQDSIYDFIDRGFIDEKSGDLIFLAEKSGLKGIINYKGEIIYEFSPIKTFGELWDRYVNSNKN